MIVPREARVGALLTTVFVLQFLVALDAALLNVALPSIATDLGFTPTGLQWVVTAYMLVFAGLLLLGGRLGDLFGRRPVVLVGLAVFLVASVVGAAAGSSAVLVGARAAQGLAGALVAPASLAIIQANVAEGPVRGRAMALWGAAGAGGGAVGVVLSGLLSDTLGWRWVLLVNVPIIVVAAVAAARGIPRHERHARREPLDVPGAVLVTLGVAAVVWAVAQAGADGWASATALLGFAAAVVLLAAFVVVEHRSAHPIMPLSHFAHRTVTGANAFGFLLSAGQLAAFYFCSLFMQQVWGLEPVLAGVLFLPFCAFIVLGIALASRLRRALGTRWALSVLGLLGAAGLGWFGLMPTDVNVWTGVFGPSLLGAVGIGGAMVVLGGAATEGLPARDAGVASGVLNSSRQLGGTVGLAVLVTVSAHVTGAATSASAVGDGYRAALGVAALLLVAAAVVAAIVLPGRGFAAIRSDAVEPAPVARS
ncbi:MFS transporter [Curtobacterium sp. 18060]|uniref:MFS transporter n=1 Tax=Curtobacterium sp. 18060 TaxID=2681408 RepID=UPI001357B44C|nr:MFS transporter [Curtobacterium sp. 18060]